MKLILHIGSSKTGSTALQQFLSNNAKILEARGIQYPRIGMASHAHHVLAACFHQDAFHMHRGEITKPMPEMIAQFDDAFRRMQDAQGNHTLVISSEYLWNIRDREPIIGFFKDLGYDDITVFGYLRELSDWVQSQFFQAVKGGETRRFRPWLRHFIGLSSIDFDYHANLKGWDDVGDVSRVRARVYGPSTMPDGVCSDFLRVLNVSGEGLLAQDRRVNQSPSVAFIMMLTVLNALDLPEPDKARIRREILSISAPRDLHQPMQFIMPFELTMLRSVYGDTINSVPGLFVDREHAACPLLRTDTPTTDRTHSYDDALARLLTLIGTLTADQRDSAL